MYCARPFKSRFLAIACVVLAAQSVADETSWYPRTLENENGSVTIHAPQVDSWREFQVLTARLAFQVSRSGSDEMWYGTMRFSARTDTDLEAREVLLHTVQIQELAIDGLDNSSEEYALIRDAFASASRKVPLDLVLAYLPKDLALDNETGLGSEPPRIFYTDSTAILLNVDGEPRFLPIEETELVFVLNTPWDLLHDAESGALYLCYESAWLTNTELEGEWLWANALPAEFELLPPGSNWGPYSRVPA